MISKLGKGVEAFRKAREKVSTRADGRPRRRQRVEVHAVIEYRPDPDGDADPGEVVWAWVPYEEDASQGKDRPVLVIGRLGSLLAGIALTTKASGRPQDRVLAGTGAWDSAGRVSYAKIDRVLPIDPSRVRREGARFDRVIFDKIIEIVMTRDPLITPLVKRVELPSDIA